MITRAVRLLVILATFVFAATDSNAQGYSQGFASVPPLGWTLQYHTSPIGVDGWFPGNTSVFPAQAGPANSYIAVGQNSAAGSGTISNWLIGPRRRMSNGDVFKFWTRTTSGSTKADRLQVRISTNVNCLISGQANPNAVEPFSTLLLDINPTYQTGASGYPQVWTEFTATVPDLGSDRVGCVAFRYFVENGGPSGVNANYIGIDSVSFTPLRPASTHLPSDFDGDRKTDIGIYRQGPSEWWYRRSTDGQIGAFQFGDSTDVITPGDFTGDGKTDIAVFRHSANRTYILRSENFTIYNINFGSTAVAEIPVPADYDNDGRVDVAFYRPHDSLWVILFSNNNDSTGRNWGQAGDKPFVRDFDGDGMGDISVFRPSNGSWWIQKSSGGNLVVSFGEGTDIPVPADYTGDGKADIAFFRPSNGTWFVLRSEDLSYYSFQFGLATDVPASGDYDGDGKYDPTVFRPSGGVWYIGRTTGDTLVTVFGTSGDRPIPNAYVP